MPNYSVIKREKRRLHEEMIAADDRYSSVGLNDKVYTTMKGEIKKCSWRDRSNKKTNHRMLLPRAFSLDSLSSSNTTNHEQSKHGDERTIGQGHW
mmetsp:Transcript_5100/g.8675  ORF Transcript_5100/g.8675 Transcript_5100/m.8675 type:complete len:95 (+) Transcript_5100:197-481(+)